MLLLQNWFVKILCKNSAGQIRPRKNYDIQLECDSFVSSIQEECVTACSISKEQLSSQQLRECDECESVFRSNSGLQLHKKSKHGNVQYSCKHCDYQATQQFNLKSHQKSLHDGVRYACSQATAKGRLKVHQQSIQSIKYSCNQATTMGSLRSHQQSKHDGISFSRNHCDYQTATYSTLKYHKQSKHEGVRYSCTQY